MKRILLSVLLAALCVAAAARSPRIRTVPRDDRSVEFYVEDKTRPGTLTVFLSFRDLINCNTATGTHKFETLYDGTRLMTLRPADETQNLSYAYSYRFFHGAVDREIDTTFVYRMPATVRRPVRAARGVSIYDRFRREKEGALGVHFLLERGDTVYAMRRGTVVEIKVPEERDPNAPRVSFTTDSPSLRIEHPDGSLAWYICLDGEHVLVGEGDDVLPGTPLALAGSYDGEQYKVAVQTFWWESNPDPAARERRAFVRRKFFPRFATADGIVCIEKGVYQAVETEELVTREMTKKERRKRAGK